MRHLTRSAVLNGYVEVARSVGLDPHAMVARCGLPPICLTDPEVRVPVIRVAELLEASARRSGRIDFGLRLAEKRSFANLGALALLVREQPTVGKVLDVLVGYMHLHNEAVHLSVVVQGDAASLILDINLGVVGAYRQGIELALGFLHRSLQRLLGDNWKPTAVRLTHAAPPKRDAHRRFFAAPVAFDQDDNALVFAAATIDAPVSTADPDLARHVRRYLDTLSHRPVATMSARVRDCIHVLLPAGACTSDRVARHLGVDRRTVHRHLEREGESFAKLLDHVRVELATRYIANRNRPLTEVAELLGFSALSALSRWFRGRFGCSAREWRSKREKA